MKYVSILCHFLFYFFAQIIFYDCLANEIVVNCQSQLFQFLNWQNYKNQMKQNKKQQTKSPFKIAFQANIFRFIQRKKNQISLFSSNSKRLSLSSKPKSEAQIMPILDSSLLLSNLIPQINLSPKAAQKDKSNFKKRKFTHKTTLSDWRTLYQNQSNQLQKQKSAKQQDKALANPLQKQTKKVLLTNTLHSTFYQDLTRLRKRQNNSVIFSKTMSHMNIDTNSPKTKIGVIKKSRSSNINPEEKMRQTNYLTLIAKQKQLTGLHMMNEGIMLNNIQVGNDISFQPYRKNSKIQNKKIKQVQTEENVTNQSIKLKVLKKQKCAQVEEVYIQNKDYKNLSSIFGATFSDFSIAGRKDKNLKMELFKSRKNKIEQKINDSSPKFKKPLELNKLRKNQNNLTQTNFFNRIDRGKQLSLNKLIIM